MIPSLLSGRRGGLRFPAPAPSETPLPTTVEVSPSSFALEVGETQQLTATVENAVGSTTWQSSDTDVATVSSSGLVTAIGEGSATITATNNGVSDAAACTVAAAAPVLGTPANLTATPGDGQSSLSWVPAANATSHQPQYRAVGSGSWLDFGSALGGSASSVDVTGLTNGQEYEFRVVASDGTSTTTSNTDTATPAEITTGDPITLLHGVMGPPSSDGVVIKFKSEVDADGVRLAYSTDPTMQTGVQYTEPQDLGVSNHRTFTAALTGLQPDTEYTWAPYANDSLVQRAGAYGRFRTAPVGPKSFSIAFSNCNQYSSGAPRDLTVWDHIREQEPAFFCHLDDFHYGDLVDEDAATRVLYDENQMSQPRQGACYWQVPLVRLVGDHDFCGNDSYGGRGTTPAPGRFAAAEAYRVTMPTPTLPADDYGIYYAFTWGRIRFIKLDGRLYRDSRWYTGSGKTMLGDTQEAWFLAELDDVAAKLATGELGGVVVLGDVPLTGATDSDEDDWAGYNAQRVRILDHIDSAGLNGNVYWLVGDMHRQGYYNGSGTGAGVPFPSACGGSLGNAQGEIKGQWTNVDSSNGDNRVGFLTITDNGGDEITVTTSLRVVNSVGTGYSENLGGPFVDLFDCAAYDAGPEPLVSDSFESGDLSHSENGFSWTAEWAPVNVRTTRARTGTHSLEFDFDVGRAEMTFHLGGQYPRVWVDRWIWIPADYAHGDISGGTTNNKLFAMYGQTYGGSGSDRAQVLLELWDVGGGDSRLRVMHNPNGGGTAFTTDWVAPFITADGPMRRGQWNRLRYHADVGSGPGANDGVIRIWVGDTQIYSNTAVPLYPAGGSHPYFEHGYLWGANNGDYAASTQFYEDDFAIYVEDPGW